MLFFLLVHWKAVNVIIIIKYTSYVTLIHDIVCM